MDQLAAAAAQYAAHPGSHHVVLGSSQPHLQPQPPQQLSSLPPQPPHHHVHHIAHRPNVTDVAVQTDVTTIVQSKQYLRRHVRIHTGERPYRCVVCQLSFRRSHHLRRHELMHTDIRPFACQVCSKAFKQKQHLERHLASHTDVRAFACSLCNKAFKQKQHLDRHLQCHSDLRMYPCSLCDKAFKQKQHLDRHLTCHSDLRMFPCNLCDKAFKQKQHLDKHLQCHSDLRMYPCSLCVKAFKQKQHLDRHLACHSDMKPYPCMLCDKAFKQKQHLDRHMQCHSDLKPYACNLCEKAFKQKQHLDRHLLSHSGEKPFGCHMCEKAFTRKQHLNRHIKMHTGELERTYKCHVCEKMFFRSHHRDKHLKSHGIAAMDSKSNVMNYLPMNIDISKTVPGVAAINAVTSPPSDSSDSCSETDDEQKPVLSDKMNSQVNKMVEGCRKRKTHSPVRLTPGEKKMRVGKNSMSSCGTATTPSMNEADEQQSRMISQHTFDYSGMHNDIVFPRNEAVSAMALRDGCSVARASTTGGSMQSVHPMGNGTQTMEPLQQHPQHHQRHFAASGMNCLTPAQLQQLQQQMNIGLVQKADAANRLAAEGRAETPQPLVVPSSHFATSKMVNLQQAKCTSAAAERHLQQAAVGFGMVEQPVHFKSVVCGHQPTVASHQAWTPAINWPPRLSLMPDGSLQSVPALTTYGTVNMADLNQVSGAAMFSAQKAMEMRLAANLHRSPSLAGDAWVSVSGGASSVAAAEQDAQRGNLATSDRRIYSPQPNT